MHHTASTHHCHAITQAHDFFKLVGDQQNRGPLGTQMVQHFEQVGGFLGREHGSRLVQNQNFGPTVQRLQNLQTLLIAHGQIAHQRIQLDVQAGLLH